MQTLTWTRPLLFGTAVIIAASRFGPNGSRPQTTELAAAALIWCHRREVEPVTRPFRAARSPPDHSGTAPGHTPSTRGYT